MIKLCDIVVDHGDDIESTGSISGSPHQNIANMTSPVFISCLLSGHSVISPQMVLVLTPWHSDESKSSGKIAELPNCQVHSWMNSYCYRGHYLVLVKRKHPTTKAASGSVANISEIALFWGWLKCGGEGGSTTTRAGAVRGLEGCSVQFSGLFVEVRPNWK